MERIKKFFGRKRNIVLTIITAIVLVIVVTVVSFTSNMRKAMADMNTVASAKAETGSIQETVVGTGTLSSDTADEVEVPVGLEVEEVLVEEGDVVEEGTPLARVTLLSVKQNILDIQEAIDLLKDEIENLDTAADNYSMTHEVKTAEKEELADNLADMKSLLDNPVLTSTSAGIIASINLAANTVIEKNTVTTDSGTSASGSDSSEAAGGADVSASSLLGLSSDGKKADNRFVTLNETDEKTMDSMTAAVEPVELYGTLNLSVAAPVKDAVPQAGLGIDEAASHFSSSLSWRPAAEVFAADTAYTAMITLTAADGYIFTADLSRLDISVDSHVSPSISLKDLNNDGFIETVKITMTYPATASEPQTNANANAGGAAAGSGSAAAAAAGSSAVNGSGMSGSSDLSGSSIGGSGSVDSVGSSSYSAYKTVGATVVSEQQMLLNINVDELDILQISKGQKVDVELDAVTGQVFSGMITKIAADATNSGGVSKYSVEVTIDKNDSMKSGMSASAVIIVDERAETLIIPMEALQEIDGETYVYTSADGKELTSPVKVTTGLSNSDDVEILSGLDAGTEIYYTEKVIASSDPFSMMQGGGMGGGLMNQGGEEE